MTERLLPGSGYIQETGTNQHLIPGGGYINENLLSSNSIYTIVPSGSVSLIGSVVIIKSIRFTSSGFISYTGGSPLLLQAAATTYTITPSGSIVYTGTYTSRVNKIILSTGSITFTGNSITNYTYIQTVNGNVVFSGTAPLYVPGSYIPTTSTLLTGVGK